MLTCSALLWKQAACRLSGLKLRSTAPDARKWRLIQTLIQSRRQVGNGMGAPEVEGQMPKGEMIGEKIDNLLYQIIMSVCNYSKI